MLFSRITKNRKGQHVLPLTIGLLIFNIIWYIIVIAFTNDGISIGSAPNTYETSINATGTDVDVASGTRGTFNWIERFFINVWELPWWLNVFVVALNGIILSLLIAAWIRGV